MTTIDRTASGIPWPRPIRQIVPASVDIDHAECAGGCGAETDLHACPCGSSLCALTACSSVHWDNCGDYRAWLRDDAGHTDATLALIVTAALVLGLLAMHWLNSHGGLRVLVAVACVAVIARAARDRSEVDQ